ncbi:helix-turn-helix domain-containing protein [Bacillus pseudomycoides]
MKLEKLKEIREVHKMSLQNVADLIGVSKPYYWQIENGKRRLTYDLAVRISGVFNLTPDDIFFEFELTNCELECSDSTKKNKKLA